MRIVIKNTDKIDFMMKELENRISNLKPVLSDIAEHLLASFQMNWKDETDPYGMKWKPLKASTKKRRRGETFKILRDTGRMQNSFTYSVSNNEIAIGSNVVYAQFHQLGTKHMPKRALLPYRGLSKNEELYVVEHIRRWVMSNE